MSRWLANVNSLLEKLDGTVEEAIDEQRNIERDDNENLDSILAKRGLFDAGEIQFADDDVEDVEFDDAHKEDQSGENSSVVVVEGEESEASNSTDVEKESNDSEEVVAVGDEDLKTNDTSDFTEDDEKKIKLPETDDLEGNENDDVSEFQIEHQASQAPAAPSKSESHRPSRNVVPSIPQPHITSLVARQTSSASETEFKRALAESREALKEARTLRRHVVALNKQLEIAETELEAQKIELQQAGNRLETDRKKYKEEKDKLTAKHLEDQKALKKQHDQILADIKTQHLDELQKVQMQLKSAEELRMQEGGDMTAELQNALMREQELVRRMVLMEDEKETLLAQLVSLQDQQERIQSRLDSISHTADNAMMREREAEEKLDMALTMHARQIAQRQAREAELERTIAELTSSLANSSAIFNEGDSAAGANNVNALKAQIYSLEEDLETCKTSLESERQRVMIMQQELRDMSKERTVEVAAHRSKQHQFDRQVAELSLQISRLQANLREAQRGPVISVDSSGMVEPASRVMELSQELVRNQEKLGHISSELSTMRNKLEVATARAEKAESALAQLGTGDIESAPESGNYYGSAQGMRRRKKDMTSIRDAINLKNTTNESIERVGKVIDGLDKFSVETGKFLRHNPLARGGFILYLVVLHMWTFAVLFFHTHRFETVHGDFGAGHQLAAGPHSLMQHQQQLIKEMSSESNQAVVNTPGDPVSSENGKEKKIGDTGERRDIDSNEGKQQAQ